MGTDRSEATSRGISKKKWSTQHPFAMLEHRILDSPAYANLKPSSKNLLVLLARQYDGKNNGHLHATYSWCKKFGIGSDHTVRSAIRELISHGFLYRTRSHGANGAWAKYAITWKSISQNRDDLFLQGFVSNAWRDWQPTPTKTNSLKKGG